MPTSEYRARKLLAGGKAVIDRHRPFAIRLTKRFLPGDDPSTARGIPSSRTTLYDTADVMRRLPDAIAMGQDF